MNLVKRLERRVMEEARDGDICRLELVYTKMTTDRHFEAHINNTLQASLSIE